MTADSTAPPKQKSMALNQQAKGLTLETSRAPAQEHTETHQQHHCHVDFSESHVRGVFPIHKGL